MNTTGNDTKKALSFEKVGDKLLAEKSSQKKIIAAYTKLYLTKGIKDSKFITKRAAIYMKIAANRIS